LQAALLQRGRELRGVSVAYVHVCALSLRLCVYLPAFFCALALEIPIALFESLRNAESPSWLF